MEFVINSGQVALLDAMIHQGSGREGRGCLAVCLQELASLLQHRGQYEASGDHGVGPRLDFLDTAVLQLAPHAVPWEEPGLLEAAVATGRSTLLSLLLECGLSAEGAPPHSSGPQGPGGLHLVTAALFALSQRGEGEDAPRGGDGVTLPEDGRGREKLAKGLRRCVDVLVLAGADPNRFGPPRGRPEDPCEAALPLQAPSTFPCEPPLSL